MSDFVMGIVASVVAGGILLYAGDYFSAVQKDRVPPEKTNMSQSVLNRNFNIEIPKMFFKPGRVAMDGLGIPPKSSLVPSNFGLDKGFLLVGDYNNSK